MAAIVAAVLLVAATAAAGAIPVPRTHVADRANVIEPRWEQALDGYLTELEQKTGSQVVVLTIGSTGGKEIRQFALELAEQWKLGQKGKDNGLLIVVAIKDRKYAFEVGYGLEGVCPDAFCGTVGRRYFVPNFRRGRFGQGIYEGTRAVAQKIASGYGVSLAGLPAYKGRRGRRPGPVGGLAYCCSSLFPLVIFMLIFGSIFRGRRRGLMFWGLPLMFGAMGGFGGSRGSGWGGGGFGSFGGGGGGGFGGGGVSGGW